MDGPQRRKMMTSNAKTTTNATAAQSMTNSTSQSKSTKTDLNNNNISKQRKSNGSENYKFKPNFRHLKEVPRSKLETVMESSGDTTAPTTVVGDEAMKQEVANKAEKKGLVAGEGGDALKEADAFQMKEFSVSFINDVVKNAAKNVIQLETEDRNDTDVSGQSATEVRTCSIGITASPSVLAEAQVVVTSTCDGDDVMAEVPVKNRSKSVPELSVASQTTSQATQVRVESPRKAGVMEASCVMTSEAHDKAVTSPNVGAGGEGLIGSKRAPEASVPAPVLEKQARTGSSE